MISPKLALPIVSGIHLAQTALEKAVENRVSLFSAPPGYLMTGSLAGLLAARQVPVVWVHASREDADPATLLIELAAGVNAIYPHASARTLEMMRQQPGSLFGWPALYRTLAREISESVASNPGAAQPVFVIEHIDVLPDRPEFQSLLWEHFLPQLPAKANSIFTRQTPLRRGSLPVSAVAYGPHDLRFDDITTITLAHQAGLTLSPSSMHRLSALSEGRAEAVVLLLGLAQVLGGQALENCLQAASGLSDLLQKVTRIYLSYIGAEVRLMLARAVQAGFFNPAMLQPGLAETEQASGEWLQTFSEGWMRPRCIGQLPLRAALPGRESPPVRAALEHSAEFCIEQGLFEQAIPILLDAGAHSKAAQALTLVADKMLDYGQWDTLSGWMARLPVSVRHEWPRLLYIEGEIAAAEGREQSARRTLSLATRLLANQGDLPGVCQSLLAQSSLSALHHQPQESSEYAQRALSVAGLGNLPWYQSWASWQLGWLAALSGALGDALAYFRRAAAAAAVLQDPQIADFVGEAHSLAQSGADQQQRVAQQRLALLHAEQEQRATTARLEEILQHPEERTARLLRQYGWSHTPIILKLSAAGSKNQGSPFIPPWFADMLQIIARVVPESARQEVAARQEVVARQEVEPRMPAPTQPEVAVRQEYAMEQAMPVPITGVQAAAPPADDAAELAVPPADEHALPVMQPVDSHLAAGAPPKQALQIYAQPGPAALLIYLLGDFRVMVDDTPVENWPGGRVQSIFAFLLLHRKRPVQREVLMDTFWPELGPEAARNNLNVAIHHLRRVFRQALNRPVIQYQHNGYCIEPQINLWLDFVVFEQYVLAGGRAEREEDPVTAIHEYEAAVHHYQGDFLTDHPYDEWAILERERLRVLYLETLDRLSLIYFNQGNYDACMTFCQRMVAQDSCREDAHCRLMRCYFRQGQSYLALRQYRMCVEALQNELSVRPSPVTVDLYERIRRREAV